MAKKQQTLNQNNAAMQRSSSLSSNKASNKTSTSQSSSKNGSTTNTWSHSYVSTSPNTSLPTYNQQTYSSSTFNKGMPDTYKKNTISSSYLNQDMPGKYKMDTVQAQKYNGPAYNAQEYVSDYKPTEFVNNYKTSQYNSKYMPQIEQRMNDVANWSYDPMQDASYQALAAVYGARGNLAAKNSLADTAQAMRYLQHSRQGISTTRSLHP